MMTYRELLRQGSQFLTEQGIENAAGDAWYLMEYVWEMNRSYYFVHADDIITTDKQEQYLDLLKQRGAHVPLQYLTHRAYFMGLSFFVNEAVLIPRQDTEVLVETVLQELPEKARILDLCTGSGCVLLALLREGKGVSGIGADISGPALAVARENARQLDIKAEFIESDLFEKVEGRFDVIVSNPPYIPSEVIPTLMKEVKDHEPLLALDGNADGLYFYDAIIGRAGHYLSENGILAFEIGYDQGEALRQMMHRAGYEKIRIIKDLAGLDRVAVGQRPSGNRD